MPARGRKLEVMGAVLFVRIEKHQGVVGGALHLAERSVMHLH